MTQEPLTSKRRAHLRSQAHHLEPVQHIGAGGVSPAVVASVLDALSTRELIKIRVLDGAPEDVRTSARQVAAAIPEAHVVQTIGRVAVVYRPIPDEDDA